MGQARWIDTGRVPGETGRSMEPEFAVQEAMRALKDSADGLSHAAGLVDDEELGRSLGEMADRRRSALAGIMDEAVGLGIPVGGEVTGSVGGALRRGWMRLEAGMADDAALIGTVIDEEESVIDHLSRAIDRDLPDDLVGMLRTTSLQIQDGIRHLGGEA